ncbi:PREDICTED: chorismate mutase 2-like [Ipomoea nil]|uniref:chorismate mutase 2-like n=1 Tax=Ipomoea nil TaxID=35883 RepID=UPI00090125B8|nr:PREDICTED: chorismate mutase 2-like [Ipomoea nil]
MAGTNNGNDHGGVTLETVRASLIRQEDTIVFCLIERAKFPRNPTLYDQSAPVVPTTLSASLFHFIFKETEALQSKVGRYLSAEENPFFPDDVPESLVPAAGKLEPFLHPVADCINVNEKIWDVYLNQLLPLVAVEGDDGNYAATAATDIQFLQALSRRIHYGKFVAEVKFREAPDDYTPAIRAKDRDALMKLLTFEAVEEMVKKRVERKAREFSKEVKANGSDEAEKCKVDPSLMCRLYAEWVIPLTKLVEVEYLLRRLDSQF